MLVWLPASLHIFEGSKIICKSFPLVTSEKKKDFSGRHNSGCLFFLFFGVLVFCFILFYLLDGLQEKLHNKPLCLAMVLLLLRNNKRQGNLFLARIKLFFPSGDGDDF